MCCKTNNKYLYFKLLYLLSLIFNSVCVQAQVYSSDQNPPSLKWRQIDTEKFKLIYPSGFHDEAQRMASALEVVLQKEGVTLGITPHKISVVLQNQGTTSNGFVQLGPRHSEFYTTPSQSFDYQDWLNSLAVHEMRHVAQFDKLTGHLKAPFFEKAALAVFGITLPSWYYEGDAVGTETALTDAGRGRIPEWTVTLRTNTLSGKRFSYSKDFFSSYKDFTPGYYQLGFFMATKLRRDYGKMMGDSILTRIARNPFRPWSFSRAVKKYTGMNTRQLHDSTVSELAKLWARQAEISDVKEYPPLNKRSSNVPEHFLLPAAAGNGTIVALLESKATSPAIVLIDSAGKEKKLFKIGVQENSWFSYAAGKIVWDETRYDPRFHQRSFNVVNIYDIQTRHRRQLTHRGRLFAPALSPDGRTIAAVDVSYSNKISIVELDAATGRQTARYDSPDNCMLQTPAFSDDGKKLLTVGIASTGKTIFELDRKAEKFTKLFPFQLQEILDPVYAGNQILFKAHFNGTDNIYRFDRKSNQIYQVTSSKFGAFNPFWDTIARRMIFNTYSVKGYDIAALNDPFENNRNIRDVDNAFVDYAHPLYEQEGSSNIFDSIPPKRWKEKPYRDVSNLFYFHSIVPIAEDNQFFDDYNYGLEFQSDNILSTMSFYTRYQFNNALRKSEYLAGFTWKKYFPVLSVDYINRPRLIYRRIISNGQTLYSPVTWRENSIDALVTFPFTLNRFNHSYNFGFKTGTSYTNRYDIENGMPSLLTKLRFPMRYQIYASNYNTRCSRDLAPRWGQSIILDYQNFPFENRVEGELFTLRSNFYFPGIAANHSFQASFNYRRGTGNFINTIDIPRVSGYSYLRSEGNTDNTLLFDYRLPLFYPDWEIGPLAYVKRFKGGLFADFENVGKGHRFSPRSYGAELRADMNLLRFYLPNFDIGGKMIILNQKPRQNPVFEFMASYSF